jgi:threonine synthase
MRAVIFVGSGKIAYGKLSQALDYGALTVQINGDFDDAMARVTEVSKELGIYLVNSVNPFRLEGQKTIMYRVLEGLRWNVPDWIVVPGGNLGNSSAFGKAFDELFRLGLIDRKPRLAVINAAGSRHALPAVEQRGLRWNAGKPRMEEACRYYDEMDAEGRRASTIASAIEINRPVNLTKCIRALEVCGGVVREATDQEILDAKAQVGAGGTRLRTGQRGQRRRRQEARRRGRHRSERTGRLHPDRTPTQRPECDRQLPYRSRRGRS